MKITCTKKEDLINQRDKFDAERDEKTKRREDQLKVYRKARYDVIETIVSPLKDMLSKFTALEFDIYAEESGWRPPLGVKVRIEANRGKLHDDDSALSWNWDVTVSGDGTVKKESGSWSGLSAVNETQLDSLRQTVAALEMLNSIDWKELLNVNFPNADDYVDYEGTHVPQRPNFEEQILWAELEELIGKDALVKGRNGKLFRGDVYFIIRNITPAMIEVTEFSNHTITEDILEDKNKIREAVESIKSDYYTYKMKKDTAYGMINNPVETIEF